MFIVSKIILAIYGIVNFALIVQICCAENTDTSCSTLQNNSSTPRTEFDSKINWIIGTARFELLTEISRFQSDLRRSVGNNSEVENDSKMTDWYGLFVKLDPSPNPVLIEKNCPENATDAQNMERRILQNMPSPSSLDIAESIACGQFSLAKELLQWNKDNCIYKNFVRIVYNYPQDREVNFLKLIFFAHIVCKEADKFQIYQAMYNEIRSSNEVDAYKLMQLHRDLKTEIINLGSGSVAEQSKSLICKLWKENRNATIDMIVASVLKSQRQELAKETKNQIYTWCSSKLIDDATEEAIKVMLNSSHLTDSVKLEIIDRNLNSIEQRIMFHQSLINKFQNDEKFKNNLTIPLARLMNMTWNDPALNNGDLRNRYERMIDQLPGSLRNVVLFSPICIKNSHFGEYLYAEVDEYRTDVRYHKVFTKLPKNGHKLDEFKWKVRFEDENLITLKNVKSEEQLNVVDHTNQTKLAVTQAFYPNYEYYWHLQVSKNEIHMSRFANGEYLFVGDKKPDDYRRYVFTYRPLIKPEYHITWEFVNCSDSF